MNMPTKETIEYDISDCNLNPHSQPHRIIPYSELNALEDARKKLWELSEQLDLSPQQFSQMQNATEVMWVLANRKWPEAQPSEE